jgi:hypothetical protein
MRYRPASGLGLGSRTRTRARLPRIGPLRLLLGSDLAVSCAAADVTARSTYHALRRTRPSFFLPDPVRFDRWNA